MSGWNKKRTLLIMKIAMKMNPQNIYIVSLA